MILDKLMIDDETAATILMHKLGEGSWEEARSWVAEMKQMQSSDLANRIKGKYEGVKIDPNRLIDVPFTLDSLEMYIERLFKEFL